MKRPVAVPAFVPREGETRRNGAVTDTALPLVIDSHDPALMRPLRVRPSKAFCGTGAAKERAWVERSRFDVMIAPSHAEPVYRRYSGGQLVGGEGPGS